MGRRHCACLLATQRNQTERADQREIRPSEARLAQPHILGKFRSADLLNSPPRTTKVATISLNTNWANKSPNYWPTGLSIEKYRKIPKNRRFGARPRIPLKCSSTDTYIDFGWHPIFRFPDSFRYFSVFFDWEFGAHSGPPIRGQQPPFCLGFAQEPGTPRARFGKRCGAKRIPESAVLTFGS